MLLDTFSPFDRLSRGQSSMTNGPVSALVDIHRDGDRYVIDADLPGVDPSSVDVTLEGGSLTIRAQRSNADTRQEGQWLVRERGSWSFVRRFTLGDDIDPDAVTASYHDGVLTVMVPISEGARRHKVPVAVGSGGHRALGGSTVETKETDEGKAEAAHSQAS